MILEREVTALRNLFGGVRRRPREGVQRANEPYAAMAPRLAAGRG